MVKYQEIGDVDAMGLAERVSVGGEGRVTIINQVIPIAPEQQAEIDRVRADLEWAQAHAGCLLEVRITRGDLADAIKALQEFDSEGWRDDANVELADRLEFALATARFVGHSLASVSEGNSVWSWKCTCGFNDAAESHTRAIQQWERHAQ